jgi:hypothetical protein
MSEPRADLKPRNYVLMEDLQPVQGHPWTTVLPVTEEDRQLVLMALAHLAVARPGFDDALATIARRIDNHSPDPDRRPELYDEFKRLHAESLKP